MPRPPWAREALWGSWVNIWNSTGAKVRKADATVAGKHAMGRRDAGAGQVELAGLDEAGVVGHLAGRIPGHAGSRFDVSPVPVHPGVAVEPRIRRLDARLARQIRRRCTEEAVSA